MKLPEPKAVVGPQEFVLIDRSGHRWACYRVINPPASFPAVRQADPRDVRLSCAS